MRNLYKLSFGLLIAVLISINFSSITSKVEAFEVRQDKNLTKDEVINGDLFISGDNLTVDGKVNGNLFIAGSSIEVNGDVTGNVFAGGSDITISGSVSKSIYAGGNTINISGTVGREVFLGGNNVNLKGNVAEDAFIGAGNLTIKSDIAQNLYAGVGDISLIGNIGKDAFIGTSKSTNIDKTKVKGDLTVRIDNATTKNKVVKSQRSMNSKALSDGINIIKLFLKVVIFVGMYLLGLVLIKYFPSFFNKVNDEITQSFGKNLAIGLLVLCAAPLVVVLFAVTIIGIPFAIAATGVIIMILFLNSILMGRFVGQYIFKLMKKEVSPAIELFFGMLSSSILFAIPVIGFFAKIISDAIVVGAVISHKMETLKK